MSEPVKQKFYVDIVRYESGEAIDSIGPMHSERSAEKVERGVNINLNHDDYYTCIRGEMGQ